MSVGDFHHTRDPSVRPRAGTVEFLFPTCHRRYGDERKTVRREGAFEDEVLVKMKRKAVVERPQPEFRYKRVPTGYLFGVPAGYRKVKVRVKKPEEKKRKKRRRSSDDGWGW